MKNIPLGLVLVVACLLCSVSLALAYGAGKYDDTDSVFGWVGNWTSNACYPGVCYNGSERYASTGGSYARFTGTGNRFRLYFLKNSDRGILRWDYGTGMPGAYVDINQSNSYLQGNQYQEVTLPWGTYDFRFTYLSGGSYVGIDAIEVLADPTPTPTVTKTATPGPTFTPGATLTPGATRTWAPVDAAEGRTVFTVTQVSADVSRVTLAMDPVQMFGVALGYLLIVVIFLFVFKFQQWALILALISTLAWLPLSVTGLSLIASVIALFFMMMATALRALSNFFK